MKCGEWGLSENLIEIEFFVYEVRALSGLLGTTLSYPSLCWVIEIYLLSSYG